MILCGKFIHVLNLLHWFAEQLRNSPAKIVGELVKLSKMRQLDTETYADSVKKKCIRRAAPKAPGDLSQQLKAEQAAHKRSNRKHKRKICNLVKQVDKWRKKCRRLQDENKRLKVAIKELSQGRHDIILEGDSQQDMEDVMEICQKSPILEKNLTAQDDESGTLSHFWSEQVIRRADPNKRRRWNPVVLRFMLSLWEQMGEKGFRILEKENVSDLTSPHLPSSPTLLTYPPLASPHLTSPHLPSSPTLLTYPPLASPRRNVPW